MIFDPDEIVRVLADHDVIYVLIGGIAAALHGHDGVTTDLDVTPSTDAENLDRLSAALVDLEAGIRVDGLDDALPFDHDGSSLAVGTIWNLRTRAGDLDLVIQPTGTDGYAGLVRRAVTIRLADRDVTVASLDDVIALKEAADRPKDRIALPALRELRDRRRRSG